MEKEIDSLQRKISEEQLKLNIVKDVPKTEDNQDKSKKSSEIIQNILSKLNLMPKIMQKVARVALKIGAGFKNSLKSILSLASSLFNLQNIYGTLKNSANTWLSSQNSDAQQLTANIEYMKYSMGSVFAPVIQYVVNLVYQLMKAIQSVVHAFSGINMFAKSTAQSMNKTSNNASKTNKSLSGIHGEINNVSENNDSGSSTGIMPNIDLSQVDTEMNSYGQKFYDFFTPLVDSWNSYGHNLIDQIKTTAGQLSGMISSVWGSFENIITNGSIYNILQDVLSIIGNITEAFSNAWNYNGNGDSIVENLANAFENLFNAIDNVVKNEAFQEFLNDCSEKFKSISEKIGEINWQPLIDTISQVGSSIGEAALIIFDGIIDIFKWLLDNPIVSEILLAIATAIGIVSAALTIYNFVTSIATTVTFILQAGLLPIIGILLAVIAAIALIVLAIMNWDSVMSWLKQTLQIVITAVIDFFMNLWEKVSFIFEAIWRVISTIITSIWNIFSQIFNWIWQLISAVFQGILNIITSIITTIWETIKNVLGKIKEIWSNVWTGIKNIVINIWNAIWNGIKKVINLILFGIESYVNGIIKGINFVLSGLSKVANAIGSLIGLDPINLKLNTITLPRLAKGNVAYSETIAIFGEYAGASSNPEITTPQNIMRETFADVLSDYSWNNSNSKSPMNVSLFVGNKKLGEILIDDLRNMKRQYGKNIEALVN